MGSFWNLYKMMGTIKALKCCQNLYQVVVCPCPGAFSNYDPMLTLTTFMTGSNLFPDASVWLTDYTALGAHVFPSLFQFSISSPLRWAIQDQWASGCWQYERGLSFCLKKTYGSFKGSSTCCVRYLPSDFKKDGKVRKLERYIIQRSIPVWALTSRHIPNTDRTFRSRHGVHFDRHCWNLLIFLHWVAYSL